MLLHVSNFSDSFHSCSISVPIWTKSGFLVIGAFAVDMFALIGLKVSIRNIWIIWVRHKHWRRRVHQVLKCAKELFLVNKPILVLIKCTHRLLGLCRGDNVRDTQFHEKLIEEISHLEIVQFP